MPILGRHVIVINSAQMAIDMMETKGSIYSNRETTSMIKLSGWSDVVSVAQPDAFHKRQRAYIHKLFGTPASLSRHYDIIEGESRRFLRQMLSSSDDLADCIRLCVLSLFIYTVLIDYCLISILALQGLLSLELHTDILQKRKMIPS
jgi:hypothetical protein